MNRRNDWEGLLAYVNEDLGKYGKRLEVFEDGGCYGVNIVDHGKATMYADNYFEDEMENLINDAWAEARTSREDEVNEKIRKVLEYYLSLHEADAVLMMLYKAYTADDIIDYIKWCGDRFERDEDTEFDNWLKERRI